MKIEKDTETSVCGLITEIIFQNEVNHYTVCVVDTSQEEIIVVGNLPFISVGSRAVFTGEWSFHPTHGPQFKADFYENTMPKGRADILRYLSSGIIKGVRAATAAKIVDMFGEGALDILANDPAKLSEIKGISHEKAMIIGASYAEQIGVRDVVMFLQKYSISPNYAAIVYRKYGLNAIAVIKENPYILAEEVYGIGFKTADSIAQSIGIEQNSSYRIEAGLKHTLSEASQNGHTYLPKKRLIELSSQILEVHPDSVEATIGFMLLQNKLIKDICNDEDAIFLPIFFYAELGSAKKLYELFQGEFTLENIDIDGIIKQVETEQGISLASHQKIAVHTAMKSGVIVITGGPGTGKTTIINTIIKIMQELDKDIALAAPTGRAAKRITDLSGMEAKTIHRLLEFSRMEDQHVQQFLRNEQNPLNCDVLIIDEMSMVDSLLFYALLKAVKIGTRLILVGDADQLPPVGAGDVLRDIIESSSLPVVQLRTIFRQAEESMIVVNAHRINEGDYPLLNQKDNDFFFMLRESANDIVGTIIDLCKNRLPKAYGFDPLTQMQVLTPMRRSATGVSLLNEQLQKILNPSSSHKPELHFSHTILRVGDKVMQIKNNYNIEWENMIDHINGFGVFNGDVGYITEIDQKDNQIKVLYDEERLVTYDEEFFQELELAYAMTIHKSQGSEFDVVILPMFPSAPMLQNRNLLYTAVTRAKKLVILVGRERIIQAMVDNVSENKRYSSLLYQLKGLFS